MVADLKISRPPVSVDALWSMQEPQLLAAYHETRRLRAEKIFARDTARARLGWLRAKTFSQGLGGVTERMNAVEANEELARKGQSVREMTFEIELIKCDIDAIAECLRLKGVKSLGTRNDLESEDASEGD